MIGAAGILEVLELGLKVVLGLRGEVRKGCVGADAMIAVAHAARIGDQIWLVRSSCAAVALAPMSNKPAMLNAAINFIMSGFPLSNVIEDRWRARQ